jgi:hypothetical protein
MTIVGYRGEVNCNRIIHRYSGDIDGYTLEARIHRTLPSTVGPWATQLG